MKDQTDKSWQRRMFHLQVSTRIEKTDEQKKHVYTYWGGGNALIFIFSWNKSWGQMSSAKL